MNSINNLFDKIKIKLWKNTELVRPVGWSTKQKIIKFDTVISILDEVAEEYATDTNVGNNGWIPFQQRELTEEEKAFYGKDIKYMLDCKLPEEDEEILITYASGIVGVDVFMRDGSECYLDSGNDFITEAIAWQPLPEPYQKGE